LSDLIQVFKLNCGYTLNAACEVSSQSEVSLYTPNQNDARLIFLVRNGVSVGDWGYTLPPEPAAYLAETVAPAAREILARMTRIMPSLMAQLPEPQSLTLSLAVALRPTIDEAADGSPERSLELRGRLEVAGFDGYFCWAASSHGVARRRPSGSSRAEVPAQEVWPPLEGVLADEQLMSPLLINEIMPLFHTTQTVPGRGRA
jgi:hypothetical protein